MAIRIIRIDDDPILRKKSKPVTVFDERLKVLVDDMVETMHHADGVGLAAPQIGILKQVIVFDLYDDEGPMALINPRIVDKKGKQIEEEGCLSLPGRHGMVERPYEVTVQYEDVSGESYELSGEELLSRVLCHEIDHLNGVLYIDKQLEDTEKNEE